MPPEIILSYLIVGCVSLCVGSFLNVLIYRIPKIMQSEWKSACCDLYAQEGIDLPSHKQESFSIAFPASHCPHCKHKLKVWHNIPLFSYLFLRGKCGFCQAKISYQYPVVEAISLIIGCCALFQFGLSEKMLCALLFCWLLITMSVIDLKTKMLPDNLTLTLLWLGLLSNYFGLFVSLHTAVLGAIIGYSTLWIFFHIFKILTGKEGMGYGDFKLLAAFGAWFGWQSLLFILIVACLFGIISAVVLYKAHAKEKKNEEKMIPFGPYLALGGVLYLFYGSLFLSWYLA